MKRTLKILSAAALLSLGMLPTTASAQQSPAYECDNSFGDCGTPEQSGGGCGCGGGGSILVANTDLGDTYQFADDYDDDGIEDTSDNCPRALNTDQSDSDGDGVGDACDNCLSASNADNLDIDGDGLGDACDPDIDGDEIANATDNCELIPNPIVGGAQAQADLDGDGFGDACDEDIDNDGVNNLDDACPTNAEIRTEADAAGGIDTTQCFPDIDLDGTPDVRDVCPTVQDPTQADMDGDGLGDACDFDIDGDDLPNNLDNCVDTLNDGQLDGDRDGLGDACDANFCYVVMGDEANCLDPEAGLTTYAPAIAAQTGEEVMLRMFANRRSQAMRFSWVVLDAPEGSRYRLENAEGTVTISTPFEYRYLKGEVPRFTPDVPGEYKVQLQVETVWEDRVSNRVGETAEFLTTINATGESVELEPTDDGVDGEAGGCQTTNSTGSGTLSLLALLGLAGLVRRRKR